jgi:predicted DNA-binding protein (UPF0251 family)
MYHEECPFKVVRTDGGYEVLARDLNLPIGRAAARRGVDLATSDTSDSPFQVGTVVSPSLRRHVLPKDLAAAIKQLDDKELDRLQAAVSAEHRRRLRKAAESVGPRDKPQIEAAPVHLTPGKLNAVRAAFKVGVKPSQTARQFGLSQSDVRQALASDAAR